MKSHLILIFFLLEAPGPWARAEEPIGVGDIRDQSVIDQEQAAQVAAKEAKFKLVMACSELVTSTYDVVAFYLKKASTEVQEVSENDPDWLKTSQFLTRFMRSGIAVPEKSIRFLGEEKAWSYFFIRTDKNFWGVRYPTIVPSARLQEDVPGGLKREVLLKSKSAIATPAPPHLSLPIATSSQKHSKKDFLKNSDRDLAYRLCASDEFKEHKVNIRIQISLQAELAAANDTLGQIRASASRLERGGQFRDYIDAARNQIQALQGNAVILDLWTHFPTRIQFTDSRTAD